MWGSLFGRLENLVWHMYWNWNLNFCEVMSCLSLVQFFLKNWYSADLFTGLRLANAPGGLWVPSQLGSCCIALRIGFLGQSWKMYILYPLLCTELLKFSNHIQIIRRSARPDRAELPSALSRRSTASRSVASASLSLWQSACATILGHTVHDHVQVARAVLSFDVFTRACLQREQMLWVTSSHSCNSLMNLYE